MRSSERRGNMLAIVVSILFILVVLILALHTSQSKAVRNVTRGEAELQFRQSFEFEVAKLLAKDEPQPAWLKVSGDVDPVSETDLPLDYAKTLFTDDGLPDLDPVDEENPPGFHTYKIFPDTSDQALKVFTDRYRWVVTQNSSGYAMYAPQGKITLGEARGFGNPTLDDEIESDEAYSGIPVLIACKSDLEIEELIYGEAYTLDGDISVEGEGGIGYKGYYPLRAYEDKLVQDLDSLKSEMTATASSGDKTAQIKGDFLQTGGSMVKLIFGGGAEPSLNLEQAMAVPFPSIPGGSATVPGFFWEFWVHVPHPPDFADFDNDGFRDADADAKEVKRLDEEIEKVKDEISALKVEQRNANTQAKKDEIQVEIDDKEDEKRDLERELEDLKDDMDEDSKKRNDAVNDGIGGSPDEPVTRADDKDLKNTGIKGWAYGPIFSGFGELLVSLATGGSDVLESLSGAVINKVRVVHFGRKENEPEFRFDDGFYAKATFTVPPGRTFRFSGNCEFEGDLWLQKGSVMHVGGDLRLSDPNGGALNPFKPSGKLVMEEGSTLVVDGDVTLEGTDKHGSLWVCSETGKVAPISTAIFADGTVTIPHGSYTASNLEDAAKWVATKEASIEFMQPLLTTLFQDVAPNLSKIDGPFHFRKPFFASYAATFQLTIVPTPLGPVPVPSAIPLPRRNVLVPIFKGFTYLYTPMMNAGLGENLYTHADWWGFGDGVIPVVPKIDPIRMVRGITSVNLGGINLDFDWEDQLEDLSTQVLDTAMKVLIEKVIKEAVGQVIKSFLPGGGGLLADVVTGVIDDLVDSEEAVDDLKKAALDATLGPIITELERWVDDLRDEIRSGLAEGILREVNGPLIYADSISIGEDSSPPLSAGMLVAKNNITVDSQYFVGSMVCLNGDITARRLYFTPNFTRVSLYKPKATNSNWLARAAQFEYGKRFNSSNATGFATGVKMVRTEGWSR